MQGPNGVYVSSSLDAYASALLCFLKTAAPMMTLGFSKKITGMIPLPAVLNIRLRKDCKYQEDEVYAKLDPKRKRNLKKKVNRVSG
jgi:hypothetical protein